MTKNLKNRGGLIPSHALSLSKKKKNDADRPLILSALRGSLIGMAISLAIGLVLITVAAAVAYANPDPGALVPSLSLISLLLSMFACGFITSKTVGEAPLTCGIVSGGMTTFFSILIGIVLLSLPSSGYGFWQSVALHSAALAFSVLGAFAGNVKIAPKRGKRRFGR